MNTKTTDPTRAASTHPLIRKGRHCVRCGRFISWDETAVYTAAYRIFNCMACNSFITPLLKDYSKSKRGRHRTKAELLRAIRESTKVPSRTVPEHAAPQSWPDEYRVAGLAADLVARATD